MNNKNNLFLNDLKNLIEGNNKYSDELLKNIIKISDESLTKSKTCKVCNKKYNSKNRYYGSSCMKKLYNESDIPYYKEIDNKELFLHSAVIVKLGKENLSKPKMKEVCQSYFSLHYFENNDILKNSKITDELKKCVENNKKPIMKLNTAYRVNRIVKNNEKSFSAEELDKRDAKKDKEIINFFKRYFNMSKLNDKANYGVYYYMQYLIWELIINGGKLFKYDLSAKLLKHSISVIDEVPTDLKITDKETISKIKNDNKFKQKIKNILSQYENNGTIDFSNDTVKKGKEDSSYKFEKVDANDLFYSLHAVEIRLKGRKINNKWNLKIRLSDRYDFTRIRLNDVINKNSNEYLTIGNILNDMGAISSAYGVIKEYDIIIEFDWNDFDE